MSAISPSVLRGLSTLVPDSLNFVTLVEYNHSPWYLALGRESFYFIQEDLQKYKDPPIPYRKMEAVCLCSKQKTLMQVKLVKPLDRGMFVNPGDPAVKLENDLIETYGVAGHINIYNQDRKATLDSFMCYWQIDHMI